MSDEDLIKGYRFKANLSLDTPKDILKRHGEYVDGHVAPEQDVDSAHGYWTRVLKSWDDLAKPGTLKKGRDVEDADTLFKEALKAQGFTDEQIKGIKRDMMASEVGQIPTDGGTYLPFLIGFRQLVEGDEPIHIQIQVIKGLADAHPDFAGYMEALGEPFPEIWFAKQLCEIDGVGEKMAWTLFQAGFQTLDRLRLATDEHLLSTDGVGPSVVKKIRAHFSS